VIRRAAAPLALLAAALLAALGVWQVQRMFWKHALIARVEARLAAPAVPLPPRPRWPALAQDGEYRRVTVTGRWLPVRPALAKAVTVLGPGWWVMSPLATGDGVVLVNRGFVPHAERARFDVTKLGSLDTKEQRAGEAVQVTGLLRRDEPGGGFLRRNDPAHDRWYSRDVQAIARTRGFAAAAPFFLDAARDPRTTWPRGGMTVVRFPDNHLVYALTWFALATLALWSAWKFGRKEAA
jgi:surfeit locus 1 family protein